MAVTMEMIKELRERTGAGVVDCKKVLTEMDGDRIVSSARYSDDDVAQYGLERVREWIAKDHARHQAWRRGQWEFVAMRLVAIVEVTVTGREVGTLEIDGPALCGIEGDAGDEYMSSVIDDLSAEFMSELTDIGFDGVEPTEIVWEV